MTLLIDWTRRTASDKILRDKVNNIAKNMIDMKKILFEWCINFW